jgi:hypothetical protein
MISVTVQGYNQACATNSGGISRLWVGDAEDFNFTSGTNGAQKSGYSAIARRTGATSPDGCLFEIVLQDESGKLQVTQSLQNGSAQWAYALEGQLLRIQQAMSEFASKIDAASICGQLVWVVQDNNGKFWVVGEKYVDASAIVKFKVKQDGSVLDWGQALNNFSGMNFKAQGNYTRPPYEFTGTYTALSGMFV